MKTMLFGGASMASQISLTDFLENYPGIPEGINGYDLVERFKQQACQFGAKLVLSDVLSLGKEVFGDVPGWVVRTSDENIMALSVIMATGATWRKLGIPSEERFIGKGVSYCATCDGPFYKNKSVVVVGGGNTAVQEAIYLTRFAARVTVIHRRDRLRATGVLAERAMANEKIDFAWNSVVESLSGLDLLQGVHLRNVKTGSTREIPAEGVFVCVGLDPQTGLVQGLVDLAAEDGSIITDRDMRTSVPGIFACGDCVRKTLRQVVTACGDGATAAYSAQHYVEELKGISY
jgi:thioredoxin reductase (NADPH)